MKIKDLCLNSKALGLAFYEKIKELSQKAGISIKEYLADEENIRHLSLFAYDVMPLSFKLGLRHEKFYEKFRIVFIGLRDQVFNYEEKQVLVPTKEVKKTRMSKAKVTVTKKYKRVRKVKGKTNE